MPSLEEIYEKKQRHAEYYARRAGEPLDLYKERLALEGRIKILEEAIKPGCKEKCSKEAGGCLDSVWTIVLVIWLTVLITMGVVEFNASRESNCILGSATHEEALACIEETE